MVNLPVIVSEERESRGVQSEYEVGEWSWLPELGQVGFGGLS
jgi:hypothetical protein